MTCVIGEKNRLIGIITDGDLRRMIQKHGKAFLQKPFSYSELVETIERVRKGK